MAYAIMRIAKAKSVASGNGKQKHNAREVEVKSLAHPEKGIQHIVCSEEMERNVGRSFGEIFREKTNGINIRSNAVTAVEMILTFSPGGVPDERLPEWTNASMQWVQENFGGAGNIASAQLHLDETTPHLQLLIIPLHNGKLCCKHFVDGPRGLQKLQTSYAKAMEPFNLKRGISREITHAKHEDHRSWMAKNAEKELRLQAFERDLASRGNIDDVIRIAEKMTELENERTGQPTARDLSDGKEK